MANLKIEKVLNNLPTTLTPDTLYFVKKGNKVETYISDNTGNVAEQVSGVMIPHPFMSMGAING